VVYWLIAPPVSGFGDSSELAVALATNGVAHPTGYPLYVVVGHLFVRAVHLFGVDLPVAAAVWSHAGAAIAIFFIQILAWQLTALMGRGGEKQRAGAALLVATAFAVNPIWLEQATLTEVYSWHVAWACATASVFLVLVERGFEPTDGHRLRSAMSAVLWGLLVGVGLAHHRTSLLLAGPLSIALIIRVIRDLGPARTVGLVGIGVVAALAPLLSYGIIAWRAFHPAEVQWPVLEASWSGVFDHISARAYWDYLGYFAPDSKAQGLLLRAAYPFLVPGFVVLVTLAVITRKTMARLAVGALAAGVTLAIVAAFRYGVPDPQTYFLMPVALGMAAIAPAIAVLLSSKRFPWMVRAIVGAACLLAVTVWAFDGVRGRLESREDILHNDGLVRQVWNALPDEAVMVFWPSDAYFKMREYQIFQNEKPQIYVMNPSFLGFANVQNDFDRRFGFDPMEGFEFQRIRPGREDEPELMRDMLRRLVLHVNSRTAIPVVYMEPEAKILRQLPK
jgi:hypothetical protein